MTGTLLELGERDRAYNSDMTIHRRDSLIRTGLQELASDDLFHCQHNTVLAPDADSCASVLDSLDGIFNLG